MLQNAIRIRFASVVQLSNTGKNKSTDNPALYIN